MDRPHGGPAGPARQSGTPVTGNIVEARDLHLSFGSTPALRGASLGGRPGEIVAVMGPSGSGKSTLLHCLAGILVPDQGEVWFGGQRLDTLSDERRSALRRMRFGFVIQSCQRGPVLVAGPEVLFADEPTGSLDSMSGELVMNLLVSAVREQGTTVVLVTHDARVAAYADREVVVRDGTVSTLTGAKP